MSDRLHERAQQDRDVVAVAGPQLEHPTRRVQDLDVERIFRVAHVALHPAEERVDFADVVLGRDAAGQQDVDRLLAHVEVARALADESSDVCGGLPRAGEAAGDAPPLDARRARAVAERSASRPGHSDGGVAPRSVRVGREIRRDEREHVREVAVVVLRSARMMLDPESPLRRARRGSRAALGAHE